MPWVLVDALFPTMWIVTLPPQAAPSTRRPEKVWLSIGDTECYAAIQMEWPMLRPPLTAAALIKTTLPESQTSTSAVLLETMPFALASTDGSRKPLAGRNPTGRVPAAHMLVEAWEKFQTISTMKPFLRYATKSSEKLPPYIN